MSVLHEHDFSVTQTATARTVSHVSMTKTFDVIDSTDITNKLLELNPSGLDL